MNIDERILDIVQAIFEQFGWLGVVAIMIFENATSISPSEIILSLAGWTLLAVPDAPPAHVFLTGFYAAAGSTLGASIMYWAARKGGRPLVERALKKLRINPLYLKWVEVQFHKWGPGFVFVGRLVPGIRALVSIPAGLVCMSYLKFLLYTLIGTYVYCTIFIGVGYTLGHEWPRVISVVEEFAPFFVVTFVLMVVLLITALPLFKRRLLSQAAAYAAREDDN